MITRIATLAPFALAPHVPLDAMISRIAAVLAQLARRTPAPTSNAVDNQALFRATATVF